MASSMPKTVCKIIFANSTVLLALLLLLLLVVIASSDQAEARPAVSSKKPPFNGSIFGKRSNIPAYKGGLYYSAARNGAADNMAAQQAAYGGRYESGVLLQQQQDSLVKSAVNRCLDMEQRDSIGESTSSQANKTIKTSHHTNPIYLDRKLDLLDVVTVCEALFTLANQLSSIRANPEDPLLMA